MPFSDNSLYSFDFYDITFMMTYLCTLGLEKVLRGPCLQLFKMGIRVTIALLFVL